MSVSRVAPASWAALGLVLVSGAGCQSLTWDDYMEAGYDAYQDGRYVEAEQMYMAAAERAETFESRDPRRMTTVNNLADLFVAVNRLEDAEVLYRQVVVMIEETEGPDHPELAVGLDKLAEFYADREMYAEAEPTLRARGRHPGIRLRTRSSGCRGASGGAGCRLRSPGVCGDAERVYQRALVILETELGPENVRVADVLENYAGLLRKTEQGARASELEARALAIRAAP